MGWVGTIFKIHILNQVTFIQIQDTLISGKLKMLEWIKQKQNFLKFHLGQ